MAVAEGSSDTLWSVPSVGCVNRDAFACATSDVRICIKVFSALQPDQYAFTCFQGFVICSKILDLPRIARIGRIIHKIHRLEAIHERQPEIRAIRVIRGK